MPPFAPRAAAPLAACLLPLALSPRAARADGGAPDLPGLLGRLAADAAALRSNDDAPDRTCVERQEELDGDGNVTHWTERTVRTRRRGGEEVKETLRSVVDGREVPPGAADEPPAEGAACGGAVTSPFAAAEQGKYTFALKGPAPDDPSKWLVHFAPKGPPSPKLAIGHALVDPVAGAALKFTLRVSKYPSLVRDMTFEIGVRRGPRGPFTERVAYRAEGGFLFWRKRVRGSVRCEAVPPGP